MNGACSFLHKSIYSSRILVNNIEEENPSLETSLEKKKKP